MCLNIFLISNNNKYVKTKSNATQNLNKVIKKIVKNEKT